MDRALDCIYVCTHIIPLLPFSGLSHFRLLWYHCQQVCTRSKPVPTPWPSMIERPNNTRQIRHMSVKSPLVGDSFEAFRVIILSSLWRKGKVGLRPKHSTAQHMISIVGLATGRYYGERMMSWEQIRQEHLKGAQGMEEYKEI